MGLSNLYKFKKFNNYFKKTDVIHLLSLIFCCVLTIPNWYEIIFSEIIIKIKYIPLLINKTKNKKKGLK